jgi:hypothetical protein
MSGKTAGVARFFVAILRRARILFDVSDTDADGLLRRRLRMKNFTVRNIAGISLMSFMRERIAGSLSESWTWARPRGP